MFPSERFSEHKTMKIDKQIFGIILGMVLEFFIYWYIFFTGLLDDVYNIYIALVFVYFPAATFRPTFRTWTRVVRLVSSCSLWTGSPSSRYLNARTRYWRYEPIEHLQLMYKHDVFTIQED